ncbi:type II secretion system F family protein, partial [archaeon]|nr:type II secretion system F family protein [archaeon]
EGKQVGVQIQRVEELQEFKNPTVKALGGFYLALRKPLAPIVSFFKTLSPVKELGYYLYSANLQFSVQQYIALTTAVSIIVGLMVFIGVGVALAILSASYEFSILITLLLPSFLGFFAFLFVALIMFLLPRSAARKRGEAVSSELPFALRHMGTELKSGIGLYRALQAIAVADYGVLSQEFSQSISEIEEGTDAQDALRHMALRTQSRSLRTALTHIIRALKTGGNLSEVMSNIAEDVSFELQQKTREFAEKMNFFGVIFIFMAIVLPVFIAILGSIRNAPLGAGGTSFISALPLEPWTIGIFYLAVMPMILIYLIFYLKMSQPKA